MDAWMNDIDIAVSVYMSANTDLSERQDTEISAVCPAGERQVDFSAEEKTNQQNTCSEPCLSMLDVSRQLEVCVKVLLLSFKSNLIKL